MKANLPQKCFLLILGLNICFYNQVSGQSSPTNYNITGTVADSATQQLLEYMSVSVNSDKNLPIKAVLSKPDGTFMFENIKPARYIIAISAVGYKPKTMFVDLSDESEKTVDLGKIYISSQVNKLKEVKVTGHRPLIRQEADRISYDMQADPENKGSSVLGMIRKVPFLAVDADDNVLMKGKDDYRVFLNGKPSGMLDRNLKEVLRSMPASTIQRIEVITTPSAKYDAEGLAGIINIITIKEIGQGYNGTVNLNWQLPVGGPGVGSSFTIKEGKFGLSAYGGASLNRTPQTQSFHNRLAFGETETRLVQNNFYQSEGQNGYLGLELSFEIDSLNLISGQFNVNKSINEGSAGQNSVLTGVNGLLQQYGLKNENTVNGQGWDAAINYQLGFKRDNNRLLTFSYRYSTYQSRLSNNLHLADQVNYPESDYRQFNEGSSGEQTFQIDYVQTYKKIAIEAGLKGIIRDNTGDFTQHHLDEVSRTFEIDSGQSNLYFNGQDILGAYNTYQFKVKKWGFKTGVRLEQTVVAADFISSASITRQNYFNLIPVISINRKLQDWNSLSLGFSQRIKRPGINRLNPFVNRANPYFEISGNPDLRPALINSIQVGYFSDKKLSLNLGLEYNFVKNLFMQVASFNSATQITLTTYQNTGRANAWDANISINYPITKVWNLGLNGSTIIISLETFHEGALTQIERFTYNGAISSGYTLPQGWRLNGNLNLISRNIASLQGTSNALISSSVSVNKEIFKNKFTFSAAANNPFTKYRNNRIETIGTDFTQINQTQDYFRNYRMSLNYRFGKLKEGIKKSKRSIKNDDLSN